jgi:hypothetical protein
MSKKDKIQQYETVLHLIQMYSEVTMNEKKLKKLISNICSWSYSHRSGSISEKERKKLIKEKFDKLLDV